MSTETQDGPGAGGSDVRSARGNILVTGSAGFIGSHLCDRLLEEGYAVWGLDNFDSYYSPSVKRRNLQAALQSPRMHLVEGDLRDGILLSGLFADVEFAAAVHLADRPSVRAALESPIASFDVNIMGTLSLLEAMRRHHVPALLFGSTASVYGPSPGQVDETARADRPASLYAASKRSGEIICHAYHRLYGLSVHCLRLSDVFGPRERPDLEVHSLARELERGAPIDRDGTALRNFAYVGDIVNGVVQSLRRVLDLEPGESSYEVINLGGAEPVRLERVAETLSEAMGLESPPELDGAPEDRELADPGGISISRARDLLGYAPAVGLQEGLAKFLEWFTSEAGDGDSAAPVLQAHGGAEGK